MDQPNDDLWLTEGQKVVLDRWLDRDPMEKIAADLGITVRAVRYRRQFAMYQNGLDSLYELAYYYGEQRGRERRS
jgi:FixJ family two-component response regulator